MSPSHISPSDDPTRPSSSSSKSPKPRESDNSSDIKPLQSAKASSSRSPTKPTASSQWATKPPSRPRRTNGSGGSEEAVEELTDESSDNSGDNSDELDETDDEGSRERSGSQVGEHLSVSAKDLVYVLEVIQQPQRARACGFGDKDRRPLSPPPIIQLRILDKSGMSISPNLIDHHRLILMVDLWNGDQTQQRSIVMHPGVRQDQYALYTHTTASRPSPFGHDHHQHLESPQSTFSRLPMRSQSTPWTGGPEYQAYGRPPHFTMSPQQSFSGPLPPHYPPPHSAPDARWAQEGMPPHATMSASPAAVQHSLPPEEWYDDRRPSPSVSSRHGMPTVDHPHHYGSQPPPSRSRGYTPDERGEYGGGDPGPGGHGGYRPASSSGDGWYRDPRDHREPPSYSRDGRPLSSGYPSWDRQHHYGRPWGSGDSHRSRSQAPPLFTHHPGPSPIASQSGLPLVPSPGSTTNSLYPDSYGDRISAASHYSRVLVGSMGTVCQRLKGLDGEPGLFFFAHDLGIRTEGTFSLRFTLADITSLSIPTVEKDQSSPVLSRIYSNAFTVYSAKRFPGVLPTTDLTQCFADQSVRLPTRQKRANNSSVAPKRKK